MNTLELEDVLSTAAAWRAAGEQVAVATVTETWGSSPRPAGSQMAVTKSGRMAGSVSGGCIEGAVADAAMKTIETGSPQLLDFGKSVWLAAARSRSLSKNSPDPRLSAKPRSPRGRLHPCAAPLRLSAASAIGALARR